MLRYIFHIFENNIYVNVAVVRSKIKSIFKKILFLFLLKKKEKLVAKIKFDNFDVTIFMPL